MIQSLGKVTVPAHGTPVRATTNLADPTARLAAQAITFQALPGNAGIVYVGLTGMVVSSGVQCLGQIPKPENATSGPFATLTIQTTGAPNGLDASMFYLDSGSDNDGVIVSLVAG